MLLPAIAMIALAPRSVPVEVVPMVLIVQELANSDKEKSPDVEVANFVAEEVDKEGRAAPVVWGMTDPYFRAAIDDGILKSPPPKPSIAEAQAAASKLKADYLLVLNLKRSGPELRAKAVLYRRGKQVWMDPSKDSFDSEQRKKIEQLNAQMKKRGLPEMQIPEGSDNEFRRFSVTFGGTLNEEDAARSVARTWSFLLSEGPWRSLTPRPRNNTPELDPGVDLTVPDVPPVRKVDNAQLVVDVQKLLAKGDGVGAINLLRDAIDTEPLDPARRRMLAMTLLSLGQLRPAAEEARRAAHVLPDQIDLWVIAARSWLRIGDLDEASSDLNEAVARDPERAVVRELLGEMYLTKLDIPAAIDNFNAVISKTPTADALFLRGLALTIGGEEESARKDFEQANTLGLLQDPISKSGRYAQVTSLVDASVVRSGSDLRSLLQKARLSRSDAKVGQTAGQLLKYATGLARLIEGQETPERHRSSGERRRLALNLLRQSLNEVQEFLKTGDEDVLSEAAIDLGEALKQLVQARDLQKSELARS